MAAEEPDARAWADEVEAAVQAVCARHGQMLGRFVFVGEVVETEGERTTWVAASRQQKPWESLGLLHFGIQAEQAWQTAGETDGTA